ncbi:hypothetical protein H5410_046262 [Solanum commersonii]|uniref:Uncharacterized protein n=1 Tax=Solanum commersonii TaxID=4109 RepID=A0A9J5XF17_SOLCO|nr:hypothetical protein H5410_046262 [Solanum commersonii]
MDITLPLIESVWIGFDSNNDINGEGHAPPSCELNKRDEERKKYKEKEEAGKKAKFPKVQRSMPCKILKRKSQRIQKSESRKIQMSNLQSNIIMLIKVIACTSSPTPHGYPNMCVVVSPPHGYPIMRASAPNPHGNPIFCAANYDLLVERGEDDSQEDVIGGSDGCQEKPIETISTSPPHLVTSKVTSSTHKSQPQNIATSPKGKANPNAQKRKEAQNKKAELYDQKIAN